MVKTNQQKARKSQSKKFGWQEYSLISIIIITVLAIITAFFLKFFFNQKAVVQRTMGTLISDYYENYLYQNIIGNSTAKEVMPQYVDSGIPTVRLRELLYYDNDKNIQYEPIFEAANCDKNATSVRFYPEEPFGKKDYRIEYTWRCTKVDFEQE